MEAGMELTILMPCLNEEQTLGLCIREAQSFLDRAGVEGEILIADNGSTDRSREIARELGARVADIPQRGYGSALRGGIAAAHGRYVIMGDSDYSYNFSQLDDFLLYLRQGYDLVIGNRFTPEMEKGAMSFSHRYIGVPALSWMARVRFHTVALDYHCGLRAVRKESYDRLTLYATGMEYATEMIGAIARAGGSIREVPIAFRCDKRGKPSHIRSIRDGLRHVRVILAGTAKGVRP